MYSEQNIIHVFVFLLLAIVQNTFRSSLFNYAFSIPNNVVHVLFCKKTSSDSKDNTLRIHKMLLGTIPWLMFHSWNFKFSVHGRLHIFVSSSVYSHFELNLCNGKNLWSKACMFISWARPMHFAIHRQQAMAFRWQCLTSECICWKWVFQNRSRICKILSE